MTTAIVVGGGAGLRLGADLPKALRKLGSKPLLFYALATLQQTDAVDSVVVVVPEGHAEAIRTAAEEAGYHKVATVVTGGRERQDSVLKGLAVIPQQTEWVAVHDAARPFASVELFTRVIAAAQTSGGAIAALPATETLKRASEGEVIETVPRALIWHAQTPQVFRAAELAAALTAAAHESAVTTDDAEAMERAGHKIQLVQSDPRNFKISTPADWTYAEFLVGGSADDAP